MIPTHLVIAKFDADDFRLLLPQASLWSMSTIRCLGSWTNGRWWFVTEKMVVKSKGIRDPKWPKQSGLGILIWSNLPRCWRGKGRLQCGHSGTKMTEIRLMVKRNSVPEPEIKWVSTRFGWNWLFWTPKSWCKRGWTFHSAMGTIHDGGSASSDGYSIFSLDNLTFDSQCM